MGSRKVLVVDSDKCQLCGGCAGTCPTQAIILHENKLEIARERCTACGICINTCPVGALRFSSFGVEDEL